MSLAYALFMHAGAFWVSFAYFNYMLYVAVLKTVYSGVPRVLFVWVIMLFWVFSLLWCFLHLGAFRLSLVLANRGVS